MPKRIEVNDTVALRGRVTRVDEGDGPQNDRVTVLLEGYGTPVTVRGAYVELVQKHKQPKIKDLGL